MSTISNALSPIKELLPEEAKDLKLNLGSVIERNVLSSSETIGVALAASIMTRNNDLVETFSGIDDLKSEDLTGAKIAASLMAMNTTWYPFVELSDDDELGKIQAGLRMNAFSNHGGTDAVRFEAFCLSAAIVGKCHKCISSHVKALRDAKWTTEQIRDVGHIASTIAGVATTLDTMAVV